MTQNPFGDGENPFGNLDLGAMLQQAQQMQEQLMATQAELAAATVEGAAGGVAVTVTGTGDLTAVTITPGSFDATDADSLADLGDLVVAAYRDAKTKADSIAAAALGPMAGALGGDLGGPAGGPLGFSPAGG